ncbi:MAG TPA: hypothetical protein VF974_04380 [Patescibacteria group bacterium]
MINNPLFPGQQENEKIYLVIRQHWMILALKILAWLLFAVILIISDWAIKTYAPNLLISPYAEIITLIKSVYLLFLILGLFLLWIMYYLNVMIVTNERVVDITQNSLISHKVSELNLNRTQDVTAETEGILETFFDFGNVYLQDAASAERFIFYNVPNPAKVEKLILDLYEEIVEKDKTNPTKE